MRYSAQASQRLTSDSAIPGVSLGRRLNEIIIDRKLSIRAFCKQNKELFGFSHELLRNIICGTRPLLKQEEKLIVQGLNLTVDRFRGEDTRFDRELLDKMVTKGTNFRIAVETALKILPVALGASERFDILYSLGRAYLGMKEYKKAHKVWSEAYQLAKFLHDKFRDKDRYFRAVKALAVSARWMRDFFQLEAKLREAERFFSDEIDKKAQIVHLKALSCFMREDQVGTQRYYGQALELYRELGDTFQIAKVLYDMAVISMKQKKFREAQGMLLESIRCFAVLNLLADRLVAIKDLVITLYHLGEKEEASRYITSSLPEAAEGEIHEMQGKFLLMMTHFTGEVSYAERAMQLPLDDSLRYEITSYLERTYLRSGEIEKAVQYSKMSDEIPHILFMDKEGF